MGVVDVPPGLGLLGNPRARFGAPPRARALATACLIIVGLAAVATWVLLGRKGRYVRYGSLLAVMPAALCAVTSLALALRRAEIRVDRDGLRWGWSMLAFRRTHASVVSVQVFRDGVALVGKRGTPWFLARRDWHLFDEFVRQLRRAQWPVAVVDGRATLRVRSQSYGRALDGLVVVSALLALAILLVTIAAIR